METCLLLRVAEITLRRANSWHQPVLQKDLPNPSQAIAGLGWRAPQPESLQASLLPLEGSEHGEECSWYSSYLGLGVSAKKPSCSELHAEPLHLCCHKGLESLRL